MRTVEDEAGRRYLVRKASGESLLVRDLRTGREGYRPASQLSVVDGESPLEAAGAAVPETARAQLRIPDKRAAGLLVTIHADGPVGVRPLLDETGLCESDLHGLLVEFVAADLIAETQVDGERGYDTTERAADLLAPERP